MSGQRFFLNIKYVNSKTLKNLSLYYVNILPKSERRNSQCKNKTFRFLRNTFFEDHCRNNKIKLYFLCIRKKRKVSNRRSSEFKSSKLQGYIFSKMEL